jgi:hypothetical protein
VNQQPESHDAAPAPWTPLGHIERRVVGVLVEKAKTTPEQYPMSVNAIRNGCNQKSNRDPKMELDDERVEDALEELRRKGVVTEIQGDGRVPKYRHQMYQWLGVDKVELAIMTELLLRGAQTVGELRTRAARMEPIADITQLWPLLAALRQRGLVVYLTPEGRGCIVTHGLYSPAELGKIKSRHVGGGWDGDDDEHSPARSADPGSAPAPQPNRSPERAPLASDATAHHRELAELRIEVQRLRAELTSVSDSLRTELDDIRQRLGI